MDGRTDRRTNGQTNTKNQKYFFMKVAQKSFFLLQVGQMSFFDYRWDKCRTLAKGGTYVYLIEGGTNVGGTNVGRTNVGGRLVASSR